MKRLIIIISTAFGARILMLRYIPHFGDIDWFVNSANVALQTGRLPLLGITASITWLHQGPIWTYMLLVPQAFKFSPISVTVVLGVLTVGLVYFAAGIIPALIMAVLPFAVIQSITPYHTTLISPLFFITYLLIQKRHSILTGLFIGFLYQSHLLTFIYWPLWLFLIFKKQLRLEICGLGFVLGILPFIISGPIQTVGIFIWIFKQLATGFRGANSGISTAYLSVLLPGVILGLGMVLKKIRRI